jgi:hypothetical protein
MNRNAVVTFFNKLEKVATENKLSDTSGNIFNTNGSGKKVNNKPGAVKQKRSPKCSSFSIRGQE